MKRSLLACACLAFLCSCSTLPHWSPDDSTRPQIPVDQPMDMSGVPDGWLLLTLRLDSGETLLVGADSGSPDTVLDKSLESKLGKRLGTSRVDYAWYGKAFAGVYRAPALYLGNTRLLLSDRVLTDDLRKMSPPGRPIMGILGLDCLRHYCVELDFDAGKISFLDPDHLRTDNLGTAFPMTISGAEAVTRASLFGLRNVPLVVDTGCSYDAVLKAGLVRRGLRVQKLAATGESKTDTGAPVRVACFESVVLNGIIYRHFLLADSPDDNLLGLGFMERNLVTLNFPRRLIYLRRRDMESVATIVDLYFEAENFFKSLQETGRLPGFAQGEHGHATFWMQQMDEITPATYPFSRTVNVTKAGDVSGYHYTIENAFRDGPWTLQRAWRTDADGRVVEAYPVP